MKIKNLSVALLSVLMLTGIFIALSSAASFPNLPPTEVTMHQNNLTPYDYPFVSQLSNVPGGYDVSNGIYTGWCVDLVGHVTRGVDYQVLLYSSLSPPAQFASIPWNMINYILNHKQGTGVDISQAIWYFVNGNAWPTSSQLPGYPNPLPPTATAQAMVTDALANGAGYIPGPGEIVAVIADPTDVNAQDTIIELRVPGLFPKQFTSSFAINGSGFVAPTILDGGLNTSVVGLHSGPSIYWVVTYYFANTAEYLGSQYDGQGHYFRLWDKWGGNLMVLDSQPTAFNPTTNIVTLANNESFDIKPGTGGYKDYVGTGLSFTDSNGNPATATLHTGDQQQKTNPGKGGGTQNDGSSYDMDIVWNIGYLAPGESASLSIVVAPGKNPAGNLAFSSPGFQLINTGPRARVYGDAAFTDFLYAIDKTVQLGVIVTK